MLFPRAVPRAILFNPVGIFGRHMHNNRQHNNTFPERDKYYSEGIIPW